VKLSLANVVKEVLYDDNLRTVREWYASDTDEYCSAVELRIPAQKLRRAASSGEAGLVFDSLAPLSRKRAKMARQVRYDNRPRLTLGKRRGKK